MKSNTVMTLHDLFNSVEFDDIFPYVVKHDSRMKDCDKSFRLAFTALRLLQPAKDDGEKIHIDYIDDDDPPDESFGIGVYHCEDEDWSIALGREVVVSKREPQISISKEEMAALCFWEITFYGFSEHQRDNTLDWHFDKRPSNHKWRKLKEEAQKKRMFPIIDYYDKRKMNGPKRHRYWRVYNRIIELGKFAHIERLCDYVDKYRVECLTHKELWDYADNTRQIWGYDLPNPVEFSHKRLLELDKRLIAESFKETKAFKIYIISPGENYEPEAEELKDYINVHLPDAKVYFGKNLTWGIAVELVYLYGYSEK